MNDLTIEKYADSLFDVEDSFLKECRLEAERRGLPAIQVPTELARMLTLLVRATGAMSILEIGTLFGYSSIVMGRALPEGGKIVTLEVEPKHAALANENVQAAGLGKKIEIQLGAALESLRGLVGQTFDMIFIDADKPAYPAYMEWARRLSRPGTLIVSDNVWRGGAVLHPDGDAAAQAMAGFNKTVAADPTLSSAFFSTRAGADAALLSVVIGT